MKNNNKVIIVILLVYIIGWIYCNIFLNEYLSFEINPDHIMLDGNKENKGYNYKLILITYATSNKFIKTQKKLEKTAKNVAKVDEYYSYNRSTFRNIFVNFNLDFSYYFNTTKNMLHFMDTHLDNYQCNWNKDNLLWIWKPFFNILSFNKIEYQ